MKPEWRRFAPAGLYLALFAALASATLYIIQREWNLMLQISLGLVVLGLAGFALLDPDRVRQALTGRQARYGSNALVMTLAFIGIVIVVNYLGFKNSKRWDLTEDKQNTLTLETINTLKSVPEPVFAQAFFTPAVSPNTAKTLLDQYKFESDGKFDYKFIDPDADPLAAQAARVTQDGMIVLSMDGRYEPVQFVSEKELTAGLVRLLSNEVRAVYFLTGHGERNPVGTGDESLSTLRQVLESKNYKVDLLNLLTANQVPADAKVIVIAGPLEPVTTQEVGLLGGFIANGGALIVMEEPLPLTQFGDRPDPLADYLQETWGITLGKDVVVDTTSQMPYIAFANEYAGHPISEKLQGVSAYFPTVRSVRATAQIPGFTQVELAFTADQAWAETDLIGLQDENSQVTADEGVDLIGRVPLVIAAQNEANKQRMVVFGDVDFASDANFGQLGNGDLMVNSIDWASEQENLINLTPKDPIQRTLIPAQKYTMGLILFGSVFLLPGLVLAAGVVVWVQRRKRG